MYCDAISVLTSGVDTTFTNESFDVWCSFLGKSNPDDELAQLLGSDVLVVVVVGRGGKERASINSVVGKKLNYNVTLIFVSTFVTKVETLRVIQCTVNICMKDI